MGNNPSNQLYRAARRGDVQGMLRARAEGGDVNYKNGRLQHTPLMTAAKRGNVSAVIWLLQAGAADLRSVYGESAMHLAAGTNHAAVISLLLDRGSDHFARNSMGERPIDVAERYNHVHIVRLLEARTCPFFASMEVEIKGFFRNSMESRWVVVHRARPWDNPTVSRREVMLRMYVNKERIHSSLDVSQPMPIFVSSDGTTVTFELRGATTAGRGGSPSLQTTKCRAPAHIFNWLLNILSDPFGGGSGPAFDRAGAVLMPADAVQYMRGFSTEAYTTERLVMPGMAPAMPLPTRPAATAPQRATAAPAPAPAHVVAAAPAPRVAVATDHAAEASTAMANVLGGVPLEDVRFDEDIPQDFLCPITLELMADPVICVGDGHTYSREGITGWLAVKTTSPKTNERLTETRVVPNHLLRGQILDWIEKHRVRASAATAPSASAHARAATAPTPASAPVSIPPVTISMSARADAMTSRPYLALGVAAGAASLPAAPMAAPQPVPVPVSHSYTASFAPPPPAAVPTHVREWGAPISAPPSVASAPTRATAPNSRSASQLPPELVPDDDLDDPMAPAFNPSRQASTVVGLADLPVAPTADIEIDAVPQQQQQQPQHFVRPQPVAMS